jgi:hypothetical protein
MKWAFRLYFPSEGRCVVDFYRNQLYTYEFIIINFIIILYIDFFQCLISTAVNTNYMKLSASCR